jgi:hypothetical protein
LIEAFNRRVELRLPSSLFVGIRLIRSHSSVPRAAAVQVRISPKNVSTPGKDGNTMNRNGLRLISTLGLTAVASAVAGQALAAPPAALVAAAKQEGQLTVIALPHDWCGYGAQIAAFKAKYGITVNELNPDAGSGDEVEAIKANKGNKGPQAPDVIDVGLSFGPSAKADGLLQPYKVSTWASIPASSKDADGTGPATTTACSRSR